jgi:hypothetical protein
VSVIGASCFTNCDAQRLRWGAPEKGDEAATCKRHAPSEQRANMTEYRNWFRERHWPSRV